MGREDALPLLVKTVLRKVSEAVGFPIDDFLNADWMLGGPWRNRQSSIGNQRVFRIIGNPLGGLHQVDGSDGVDCIHG
jgi:hypothetical protein